MHCSKIASLFDHLVGAREQHERNGDTNRLGSDQVYNEIETDALLTGRKFGFAQGDRTVNAKRATSHRSGIGPSRGRQIFAAGWRNLCATPRMDALVLRPHR